MPLTTLTLHAITTCTLRQNTSTRSTGNKLNVDRSKSTMVLSYTFLELGQSSMTEGIAWLTPICVRTNRLDEVDGGWAKCLSVFLRQQLMDVCGLSTSGVVVNVGGRPQLLFAELACVLADGEGHMKAWDWRGASSLKPCIKHYNVFKKDPNQRECSQYLGRTYSTLAGRHVMYFWNCPIQPLATHFSGFAALAGSRAYYNRVGLILVAPPLPIIGNQL